MSFWREMTFREDVTSHRENWEIELGRNQEDRENAVKSMVSAIRKSPTFSPVFAPVFKNGPDFKIGKKIGEAFGEISRQGERMLENEKASLQRAMHKEETLQV